MQDLHLITMDRRSTKSLWRDYGVPEQDPNAFSLQYGKDTTRDPSKPRKKTPVKQKKVDYTDHTGLLKIQKPKKAQEGVKASVYAKYPALKSLGPTTIKQDTTFTKDKTGAGSIEYFSPTQDTVTYDNGYKYPHPGLGTHGIVYDPKTNTEQDVALDMLHGMSAADKAYARRRNSFGEAFMKSKYSGDLKRDWEQYNNKTNGKNDGYEQFKKNYLDGTVRNLLFEGTPEDFEKSNYWQDAQKEYLSDPKMNDKFSKLKSYLTTGKRFKHGGKAVPKQFLREQDGYKVFIVDDNFVKIHHFSDFVEGGNPERYPEFVPKGEIWISDYLKDNAREAVILHEIHETKNMKKGDTYDEAHPKALKAELEYRKETMKPGHGLLKKGGKVGSTENKDKPGGSNAGTYSKSEGPFAGPSGGAPSGSYPIGSKSRGKSALKLAHNAPNPGGIKAAVYRKYPDLKTKKAMEGAKLGIGGMGQMQGKAPFPTKRNAPPDKVKVNFILRKKPKQEPKPAFGH